MKVRVLRKWNDDGDDYNNDNKLLSRQVLFICIL